jgi:ribosomal protein S4E
MLNFLGAMMRLSKSKRERALILPSESIFAVSDGKVTAKCRLPKSLIDVIRIPNSWYIAVFHPFSTVQTTPKGVFLHQKHVCKSTLFFIKSKTFIRFH